MDGSVNIQQGLIDVQEFMPQFVSYLKQQNLVIVPAAFANNQNEEAELRKTQAKLLRKKSLTIHEISKNKIIPKTFNTISTWTKNGTFRKDSVFPDSTGTTKILTDEVKRVRKLKGYE
jgi:hypothetical protein